MRNDSKAMASRWSWGHCVPDRVDTRASVWPSHSGLGLGERS